MAVPKFAAGLGDAAVQVEKVAAHGIELVAGNFEVEVLFQLLDIQPAVHQNRSVFLRNEHLLFEIVLILYVADNLLDEILDGDQSRRATVFINGDRHVNPLGTELVKQLLDVFRFRDEIWSAHQAPDVDLALRPPPETQQVLGIDDPDDVVR